MEGVEGEEKGRGWREKQSFKQTAHPEWSPMQGLISQP